MVPLNTLHKSATGEWRIGNDEREYEEIGVRQVWDSLSLFLKHNIASFNPKDYEDYQVFDANIKIISYGGTRAHDGNIEISMELVNFLAYNFGFSKNEVLLYLVEHETTHLKLNNGNKIGEKYFLLKDIRAFSRYLQMGIKEEQVCIKNSKQFPCSEVLNKNNISTLRKIHTVSLRQLREDGIVKATLRTYPNVTEYEPYLFFAPRSEEVKDTTKEAIPNYTASLPEEIFCSFDLETTGYFQNKTIFGASLEDKCFFVGVDKKNQEKVNAWLTELFMEDKELNGYTYMVLSLEEYFDYLYAFPGYLIGANPLFDLSRGITDYISENRKYPSLIRGKQIIDVKDRGYGKKIRKYTVRTTTEHVGKRLRKSKTTGIMHSIPPHDKVTSHRVYNAQVLDVLQIGSGLTGKKIGLKELAEELNTNIQKIEHPFEKIKFDKPTLQYMLYDVLTTKAVYDKLFEIFNRDLTLVSRIVSSATVGKYVLQKCGIKKPYINPTDKGRLYEALFGGRSEVNFRGMSETELYNLDFFSQYPVLQIKLNLQRFMLTNQIDCIDKTNDTSLLKELSGICLEDLKDPGLWERLSGLVLKLSFEDIRIPVRIKYGKSVNVQLPYATSNKALWYSVFDYIAARLYQMEYKRGEITIHEIKKYVTTTKQNGLTSYNIFGITIQPETMFLDLVKYRVTLKEQLKKCTDTRQIQRLNELIYGVKIILNATAYGATIERNEEPRKKIYDYTTADGTELKSSSSLDEGQYTCPIVGLQITGSARLLLAICEILEIKQTGNRLSFIDTDGLTAETDKDKIDFFKLFSPVPGKVYLEYEKIPKTDFYGIAPKRYIKIANGVIWEKAMRTHGLGSYPSFIPHAEDIFSSYLGLIEETPDIDFFLSQPTITKLNASTSGGLKTMQDKCSWIKPYSFGFVSIPNHYTYKDKEGSGIRMFDEKLSQLTDIDSAIMHSPERLLKHKEVRDNYFRYTGQKYAVNEIGWNNIPNIKLSDTPRYITKMSNQAISDNPKTYVTEETKRIEKREQIIADRRNARRICWLFGLKMHDVLHNPKRGYSTQEKKHSEELLGGEIKNDERNI